MVIRKTSAETIVTNALELFRAKGYRNTSMADVGRSCGLLKGSIYHYFPSKKSIAIEVLRHVNRHFRQQVFRHAYERNGPPIARMEQINAELLSYFSEPPYGCVVHNLALAAANGEPDFFKEVRKYYDAWIEAYLRLFAEQFEKARAHGMAVDAVARVQGAIMMNIANPEGGVLARALEVNREILEHSPTG